ncbi:LysR family transcriptional regulator [Colwellia sp. C1TZA3]|uniref:LysR family transcriptional regulator n=1 Tax=Colwellia sp. C1TZA3 TaxID=2508879 RepID=UPI0011BA451C|nr:LysR family transcriptional regulator [Colwellia sp. C1TZA3]TWX67473.1 LysR family transcriptional regulator [Colwellia sp. C1TZA3]
MFEIKHLKTLATLADTGNIRKTADLLFSSQSALSHQIKELEKRLNARLFIRNTSPVQFTETGQVLLELAHEILPNIARANAALTQPKENITTLKLAIACHACFQWLLPVIAKFSAQSLAAQENHQGTKKASTEKASIEFVDDNFSGFASQPPSTQQQTSHQQIDILFTDEKVVADGYIYQEIGQFEVVAVLSKQQAKALNNNCYITAADFRSFTLLTYPLSSDKLDIFTLFLVPAKISPSKVKQVSNSHVMLQMVAANMGVATLPDWLVSSLTQQSLVTRKSLGKQGIYKTLYARYYKLIGPTTAAEARRLQIIETLLPEAIQAFSALYAST